MMGLYKTSFRSPGGKMWTAGGLHQLVAWGALILALLAPAVHAQEKKRKRVIRLDAVKIEGRIQKPQAFYILQRSQLEFGDFMSKESLLPKVESSVNNKAF